MQPPPDPAIVRRHGDYTLGRLTWRDLPQVVALERAVFPEPLSLPTLIRLRFRPDVTYLGAHPVGSRHLAAYYGFESLPTGHGAHVLANSTHPDDRRRGLARALITWGSELARARGVRWIVGEVRVSNVVQMEFMAVMGWKVGERMPHFFGNGEDAWMVYHCIE